MAAEKATRLTIVCSARGMRAQESLYGDADGIAVPQADQLGRLKELLAKPFASVRCGSDASAVATAALLADTAQQDPLLADLDFGRWSGRALSYVATSEPQALSAWMSDPAAKPHGGESISELLLRSRRWLDLELLSGGHHLVIASRAACRALVIGALEAPETSFWRLDIEHLSVTRLTSDGRRWSIRSIGCELLD